DHFETPCAHPELSQPVGGFPPNSLLDCAANRLDKDACPPRTRLEQRLKRLLLGHLGKIDAGFETGEHDDSSPAARPCRFSHVLGSFIDPGVEVMLFALMLLFDADDLVGNNLAIASESLNQV